jgi:hypothetical protein
MSGWPRAQNTRYWNADADAQTTKYSAFALVGVINAS